MVLHCVILMLVHNIGAVLRLKVAPVSAVFAVIPVVVVVVVAIVDADLHAGLLRPWGGRDDGWCSNGGSQDDRTDVMIQIAHDVFPPIRETQFRNPGKLTMHLWFGEKCSIQHSFENYNLTDKGARITDALLRPRCVGILSCGHLT